MKKFALTAIAAALFSTASFAEEITLGARDFVEDMGNGVVLHKHYDPRTKEWTNEYKVLDKDYTFKFANGDKLEIAGAKDYQATKDGLDAAMNGRPEGSPNFGADRPFPGTGVDRPEPEQPGVDDSFGQGHLPDYGHDGDVEPDTDESFGQGHPGEGSVERPQPGNGNGSVERPQPGAGEGSVERPQPPAFVGQVGQNKDNIAAMGEAFEQRVDNVNSWLTQAGNGIQANSDKINNLAGAFEAQAAHTTKEIARLDGRIDALEEKTDKMKAGIAGAHAVASLTQYHGVGQHHVAVGIGTYDGEAAVAGGYTYAFDDKKTTIRGTFAIDTENELAVGASIGHSW